MSEKPRGEVTAFLSLIFILLVAFAGAIMESASIQLAKNYRRADMNRAIESVFAEYQKELLTEFELFAVDAGYESGTYSEEQLINRLAYYGAGNMEHKPVRLQLLTDDGGKPFREQVSAYIGHKYGLDSLKEYFGTTQVWKEQAQDGEQYLKEEQEADQDLNRLLEEAEGELPMEDNPLPNISNIKKSPLVDIVMPKGREISAKSIDTGALVSNRRKQTGHGTFKDVAGEEDISVLGLGEYLLEHFSSAAVEEDEGGSGAPLSGTKALEYELEYILSGNASDRENLEAVTKKLVVMRFAPNYGYLLSDGEKRAQAETLALSLCTLLAVPAVTKAVCQVLLLAWAFGESIMDIRSLLSGRRVPLLKTKESWQLALSSLLTLGTEEDTGEGKDTEGGLAYEEYLRMLLFLQDKSQTAMRSLDMIEKRLRLDEGFTWFYADYCVTKMEVESKCTFRRGITYTFKTYFGYR